MRVITVGFLTLLLLSIFPSLLMAQNKQDYHILLNSGKFIPAQNISSIGKTSDVFTKSSFGNKSYVVLQFSVLPSPNEKAALSNAGIRLVDYIPNNAFTAVVANNFNLNELKSNDTRAVFQFSPEQKTVPQLMKGNFPAHAVKSPGLVDLTVTTYEKLNIAEVAAAFTALNISVLEDMPMFRSFT
ncbi:MAG TPA: hypothetical protein VLR49_14420, partial [Ferruginibacter sp.]|nr:hypothetical protein [Ferruginibacter sp.]